MFRWLRGRSDRADEIRSVHECDDGVYVFDGKCFIGLSRHEGEAISLVFEDKVKSREARAPRTITEAALVEYAQVEKSLVKAHNEPSSRWVKVLLGELERLQNVAKVLSLSVGQEYQDTDHWYVVKLGTQRHACGRVWNIRGEEHNFVFTLDGQARTIGLWQISQRGMDWVLGDTQHPGFDVSNASPTSIGQVLSFVSCMDQGGDVDGRTSTNVVKVFLGHDREIVQELIKQTIAVDNTNRLMATGWAQLKNMTDEQAFQIAELTQEINKLRAERESLRKEVACFRVNAGRAAGGDSKNVADVSASRFPSITDALNDWGGVGEKFSEFYDDLDLEYAAKIKFARGAHNVMKRMYDGMAQLYKDRLEAMLHALGDLETVPTLAQSTMDAFNVYCRKHWVELFVNHSARVGCEMGSGQKKRSSLVEKSENDEGCNGSPIRRPRSENNVSGTDGMMLHGDQENTGMGAATFAPSDLAREFMQEMDDKEWGITSDEIIPKLQDLFMRIWRTTVAMFLQRPLFRLQFDSDVKVAYSGDLHKHVYKKPEHGEITLLVVPPLVKAPDSFEVLSSNSDIELSGWIVTYKGYVDKLQDT